MKKVTYNAKQVRLFLLLLLAFLVLLTMKFIPRSAAGKRAIWWAAEASVILFFLVLPRLFFPAFRLIMTGTGYFGNFVFGLISTLIFFLVLTPISLFKRLTGKKFMAVRIDPASGSYYEDPEPPSLYEKQF